MKPEAIVSKALSALFCLLPCSALASFAGKDVVVPAVGHVEGVNGSNFLTSVWITNPGSAAVDFEIRFLTAGQTGEAPKYTDQIAPGATRVYENIAETLFGVRGV